MIKGFWKNCSKQALEIETLELFIQNNINYVFFFFFFFFNNWMLKFNRSLSTTKLVRKIFYVSLHDFKWQSGHYFVTSATGQINMSLRNTIHYVETRGSSGQWPLIENDFIQGYSKALPLSKPSYDVLLISSYTIKLYMEKRPFIMLTKGTGR